MMIFAAIEALGERDVVLRDGSTVHLRPVRSSDESALTALLDSLSVESLRFRFFTVRKSSRAEVRRLVGAALPNDVALIAELGGRICAAASFTVDPGHADRAEVSFVIADALQGRGIGTHLLESLADLGRACRLRCFDAYVLGANHRMMQVFRDSGYEVGTEIHDGVFHVVLSLARTARAELRQAERSEEAATASMRRFFEPRGVAVVGANRERGKIGAEVLHNIVAGGFPGTIAAVHPTADMIDGAKAFRSVADLPKDIDLAVICVPATSVLAVVDDCLKQQIPAIVVISAGFGESGEDGRAREAALLAKIRCAGARLIGPNCMGLINTDPAVRLNATFAPVAPLPGRVAMSTQSGALGLAILDYARALRIGLSTFVSIGNKTDVSSNDLLQYWSNDPKTEVILLYLESFGNPKKFSQIALRVSRRKPILAVKSGRSSAGARAARSHTGALASSDAVVDALFKQAGVIRTDTLEQLFDAAALLANQPVPRGRRVAVVTNAGGPGILAADACEGNGLVMPTLEDRTIQTLRSFLPTAAATGNPVDMLASASAQQYERTLQAVLSDRNVDSVLAIYIPPLVTRIEDVAAAVKRAAEGRHEKTIAAVFMSAASAAPLLAPVPCFMFPEAAAVAIARAAERAEWLRTPPGEVPAFSDIDATAARSVVEQALERGEGWLTPAECVALLAAVRVPAAESNVAASEAAAVSMAGVVGYPVVLKAVGPEILHKTEIGGVIIGLENAEQLRSAWRDLSARLGDRMTGAIVQKLVRGGVEMLVGATDDPTFGPVLACAFGGTSAEVLADSQCRLHPLTRDDAVSMIGGLRCVRLLRGYRGAPAADEAALADVLLRLSALIDICPEICEIDINPLRVFPQGACALDVRARVANSVANSLRSGQSVYSSSRDCHAASTDGTG
jgi:acetyl coenzyme A synthetase (ADP forming)-like protein